ncbi:NAD(P)(+) transhydrogenase (Re/Si-specific) subunit beta [Streptomyces sp. NPDC002814]
MTSPGLLGVRSLVADSWWRRETCGVRPDGSQLPSISGMPILDVDKAKSVVIKRSMGHGYAGIDNELYTNPRPACSSPTRRRDWPNSRPR